MHHFLDDTLQFGIDAVSMLSPTRLMVLGWAVTPRGVEAEFSVAAGEAGECTLLHTRFHRRPDVLPSDPLAAEGTGYLFVAEVPEDATALSLTLAAGPLMISADLRDRRVPTDLFSAFADRTADVGFGLLTAAREEPILEPLLNHLNRPLGAFGKWLAEMLPMRGREAPIGPAAEGEALAAASGEVLAMLRFPGVLPRDATIEASAIGWLRGKDDIAEPVPLAFAESEAARLPAALAFYGRVDPAVMERLQVLEVVLHVSTGPRENLCIRCQPATATVPAMLDLACRATAPSLAVPVEAVASSGIELLRRLIARREAAFGPLLGALASPGAGATALPRLVLILGADDPAAARMFQVTAEEVERRCDTVLVIGGAADETAQVFARRGKIKVLVGVAAADALREAAGRAGVIALDAAGFAAAVIAGDPGAAFARPLAAGETARLLALHAAAGCAPELSDSLQRLMAARRDGRFSPVLRDWANRHAASMINAHLARLWTGAAAEEAAPHG